MHRSMKRVQAAARALSVIAGLCIAAAPAYAAEEEARVLILNALDPYLPAYLAIDTAMRASLAEETTRRIVLYSELLDAQRFPGESMEPEILALLTKKYRTVHIDVVVTVTKPAFDFFKRYGEQLWPGARLVFHGLPDGTDPSTLPPGAIGQVNRDDFGGTIDLARRLQPNARRILVISGAAPLDLELEQRARQVLPTVAGEAAVEFLSGLPLPELVIRVAGESPDTIVLYLTQFRDHDGRPSLPREVLHAISSVSAAPVYGLFETYVGYGIAAGNMEFYEDRGRLVGQLVRDALTGSSPVSGQALYSVPSRCVADTRALQRWSLDEGHLPTGCDIRFADRPLWRQYWWQIVVALAIIVGQTALIVALMGQHRRRRLAESEAQQRFAEMAHMNRRVALGELSSSIAHELSQPLGAILRNTEAAELFLECEPPDLDELRAILVDIRSDDKRAGEVIERLRALLKHRSFSPRALSVDELLNNVATLTRGDSLARKAQVQFDTPPGLPTVMGDPVHLQQVLLNLVLNALDAVEGLLVERRKVIVRAARYGESEVVVTVFDSGSGIASERLAHLFDPFFTTKPNGMGIGLSISRTIIEAHGGRIWAESSEGHGSTFYFTIPSVTRA
jgi:signal transduction histidine kinase